MLTSPKNPRSTTYISAAALLLAAQLLACPARAAGQDITSTFNTAKLRQDYSLSCSAQQKLRQSNMPPPHFEGRPAGFANKDHSLKIYSPHFTPEQRALAEKLFASVPAYALPLAYRGGAVYVFTRRSIVEAVPALAVEPDWFSDYGLYMAVEKRLYLPFERGVNVTRQPGGLYAAQYYVPSQREPFRIVNHETGHLMDAMLGAYSLDSTGEDGDSRLSNRRDYHEALRADLIDLLKRRMSRAQIQRLGYYLPYKYDGMVFGGMQKSEQRVRREIFAELWAETHGYDSNKLSAAYPRTFKVVREIAGFLKNQHEQTPHYCPL